MFKSAIKLFCAVALLLLCTYCANMRPPGGGPKDVYPPLVEESDPPNYSTHFTAKKIELKFDEFVTVSDVAKEVFISPPLQKMPDIKTRGKSVIISFDEKLHDSTTYSIYFGKSIKDNTEGNPLENYNYVFSTGGSIDSLSIVGEVIDAYNLAPLEDILVMLYEDNNDSIPFDSLPFLVKPSYLTRTNQQGFFVINNLREGEYQLFGLADNNLSATYDNAEEDIAFLDSLISPVYLVPESSDTLNSDSLAYLSPDSAEMENSVEQLEVLNDISDDLRDASIADQDTTISNVSVLDSVAEELQEGFYTLFLFREIPDTVQRLLSAEKPRKRVLRFTFRYPAEEVEFTPLTPLPDSLWKLDEWNKGHDTLRYYILSDIMDTISLKIHQDTTVFDTVSFTLNEPELPQKKKDMIASQILKVSSNKKVPFPYYDTFDLHMINPIIDIDLSAFILAEGEVTMPAKMEIFGQAKRKVRLLHPLKENTAYNLFFPDSVITDMEGRSNDSTEFIFSTNTYDDYGIYTFRVHNDSHSHQLIIQLQTEKEVILREALLKPEGLVHWDFLKPGKYMVKAIGDLNHNGKWDTGDFLEHRQPEPVVFYPSLIEVREAWSFEEDWYVIFK